MTNCRAILGFFVIALLSAPLLSADAIDQTINVAVTPSVGLTNLFFLYNQGDVVHVLDLTGDAPANVTTNFQIPDDLISDIPGTPYFSVIGLYTNASGGTGINVAMDPTTARDFSAEGANFDQAFPSITELFGGQPFGEAGLIAAMEDPDGFTAFGQLASSLVGIFADTPTQQPLPVFAALNAIGTTDAMFDAFSIATPGGSVELTLPSAGQTAVPEPGSTWLIGASLLAFAYGRARVNAQRSTRAANRASVRNGSHFASTGKNAR